MKLLYVIPETERNAAGLRKCLKAHPEIRFASLTAVDLGGNDTDEKIPIGHFLSHIDEYLAGGVQTDGSSVILPGIATLNDGKVDLIADPAVRWYVDYNHEHLDSDKGFPVGTLRIPSFLKHRDRLIDSRAILKRTMVSLSLRLSTLLAECPEAARQAGIDPYSVRGFDLAAATELEFWVRTPGATITTEKLAVSQILQESYWKRTKGAVRTALEHSLSLLESYGLNPEMGHKEVGGVKAVIGGEGDFDSIMEQLEVDWKYADALQAADNELLARIMIKETFRRHGLEVTFMAKPMEGVAGSGEHTHVSIMAVLNDGTRRNLFTPVDMSRDFLSPLGWGALMGLLRNYEAVGPFVTASNDAFNRLEPGFEAPVCIVASVGHDVTLPSRNRTVLSGLVRDMDNPLATRFEVRSPNPHTNTYLALAAFYQAMFDGMAWAARSDRTSGQLEIDFSKKRGDPHPYLEQDRAYRSEEDVFEHFGDEERNTLFGKPPATVWETLQNLDLHPQKLAALQADNVFSPEVLYSYRHAMLLHWMTELSDRLVPENAKAVHACVRLPGENRLDAQRWEKIQELKDDLARDDVDRISVFHRIRNAAACKDYASVSALRLEMSKKMKELTDLYQQYKQNIAPF
ncbi:MAG: glutamine synthetase [Acidobacteria bacterium]|nr:glutamine synthetase [Acidobacteriota bacterium]